MNPAAAPPDQATRERALSPSVSFIVQAPAGSGKTELLIQRFLRLLACVDEPEQVLAVTFTRKASGEMRSRVISALAQAASGVAPGEPHLLKSFELACDVLRDPRRQDWQLPRHPARLNISTIDAVNAWLAGRAPLSAGSTASPAIAAAPERLYREAARATLELLAEDDQTAVPVAALLVHLDHDAARFEKMIVAMLPRRDQWLRHITGPRDDRARCEEALRELTDHGLRRARVLIDPDLQLELTALLAHASAALRDSPADSAMRSWTGCRHFPDPVSAQLPAWQAMADALLTADGDWRKRITVQQGFAPKTAEKKRMEAVLHGLQDNAELREQLREVRILPGDHYTESQWIALRTLIEVLRLAAAQLRLVFAARGEVDFAEVASAALDALGRDEQPSELGLALDYRLRHILVDEFQDTSLAQFDLLCQLTAGWTAEDGRTLFLVGDPMQSIYRFREAEVGLFMHVRDQGVGDIRPEFLQLTSNFRSMPQVVAWNNHVFDNIFPTRDDPLTGAVCYAPSQAARHPTASGGVTCHWLPAGVASAEADRVVELVQDARQRSPLEEICILVRSRSHATAIMAALRAQQLPFVATDMENMERAGVAQDLLALTRALSSPADRLAWIGVLRSPMCGLSLQDLTVLLAADFQHDVPDILRWERGSPALSATGTAAISRLLAVLDRTAPALGRVSTRDLVEGAWLELGGPATLRDAAEMQTAEAYLQLLESMENDRDGLDVIAVGGELARHQGSLGSGEAGLQIMTIHKAKGLEFDTVILPGLGKSPRASDPPLLLWHDMPGSTNAREPILAPIGPTGLESDPLYGYLGHLERRKQRLESGRLLYVACTRARNQLHLIAQVASRSESNASDAALRQPVASCLLSHIWPVVRQDALAAIQALAGPAGETDRSPVWIQPVIRRLVGAWRRPPSADPVPARGAIGVAGPGDSLPYEWVSGWAVHAGKVVHHWLRMLAQQPITPASGAHIRAAEPGFRRMLAQFGTAPPDIDRATARVSEALLATIDDEKGRWIISSEHAGAHCEWPLTIPDGERFCNVVVDRSFVADGVRWIIDYKTSSHEGSGRQAFLDEQAERYAPQLRRYRVAITAMGGEPVRTALYFPLLRTFLEIGAAGGTPG